MDFNTVVVILLVVIAVEVGYIAYQLRGGGGLPWLAPVKNGIIEGDIPEVSEAPSLQAKVDYAACAMAYLLNSQNQRYQRELENNIG